MKHFLLALILCITVFPLCYAAPASNAAGKPSIASTTATSPLPLANEVKTNKAITLSMFMAIILLTGAIVVRAAKSTRTTADYYAAGGGISGMQNGWAIAGDYLSAATFLGIAGITSVFGADGFMYAVGPFF
ncbi:partial Monocarboxylic acid transporter, partial [Geobacteraceae bacterium]